MKWYGPDDRPPFDTSDITRIDTPMDTMCAWCDERIDAQDYGYAIPLVRPIDAVMTQYRHHECFARCILGSVAHQNRRCSCFVPGSEEEDPPGMTRREAARAALKLWSERHGH